MNKLIALAVRRPVGVSILCLAVVMFGVVALRGLAVDLLPSVDVPQITITTQYEGVAPMEVETLITRPIEQATATIEGVERIEAESSEGLSRVRLQFAWGASLETALDEVRVAVDRVRSQLPEQSQPPTIHKFDLAQVPILHLGLTGSSDTRRLKHLASDELSRALERIVGVAAVQVDGGQDREIRVALDPARLEALSVSIEEVSAALAKENTNVSAGDMREAGREVVIRTAGEFTSLKDIEDVVVAVNDGEPVRVRDLGAVVDTIRDVRSELWIDGAPGIRLQIYKQSGANTVEVAARVREEVARLNAGNRDRAELSILWDASEFIEMSVTNVELSAGIGAILAAVVLLVFLRSLRATLVVATAIPLSVVATFALMHFAGMTLNIISFGGIALGIGMLVDSAIVILESIDRAREGRSPHEAAVTGASEVAGPVVAGTLTTVAVFVPVVFVGDLAGVLFGEMALVVTFALLCSLVVALTLVPMLAARLLGPAVRRDAPRRSFFASVEGAYASLLRAVFAAPKAVMLGGLLLLLASASFARHIDVELMPAADEGLLDIDVELPVGTPLDMTSEVTREVEGRVLAALEPGELEHVITAVGPEAWWRPGGSHEGEVELTLSSVGDRERSVLDVQAAAKKAIADVPLSRLRIRPRSSNILTRIIQRGEDRLGVEIRGHDLGALDALAAQVVPLVRDVPGVTHAEVSRQLGKIERVLHVDRARAAEVGLGSAEVASAVEHYVLGRVATRYRDAGDEYDVRVVLADADRRRLELLPDLPIVTRSGVEVPLGTLVTVVDARSPSSIQRVDQQRVLKIDVGTGKRPVGDIAADLREKVDSVPEPAGCEVILTGEVQEQGETFTSLLIGILLACFLVYATMAVQFESLRQPLLVMVSVPFSFIGIVAALLLTDTPFSMNAFLGAIVLVGIVVNNAIVLIDCANVLRDQGVAVEEALVGAGIRRLRPILMTTLTTVLGLVPLAIGAAEGSEMQAPLARAVIGGLATSTLVTLVLIPCLYLVVERTRDERRVSVPLAAAERV